MTPTDSESDTGTSSAQRNAIAANWFTISRAVWNMHDALLTEQRRTNQLLATLIEMQGGTVPVPIPPGGLRGADSADRIQQLLDERGFDTPGAAAALGAVLLRDVDGVARLGPDGEEGVIAVADATAALWWSDGRDTESLDLREVATAERADRVITLALPAGRRIAILAGSADYAKGWITRLKRLGVAQH